MALTYQHVFVAVVLILAITLGHIARSHRGHLRRDQGVSGSDFWSQHFNHVGSLDLVTSALGANQQFHGRHGMTVLNELLVTAKAFAVNGSLEISNQAQFDTTEAHSISSGSSNRGSLDFERHSSVIIVALVVVVACFLTVLATTVSRSSTSNTAGSEGPAQAVSSSDTADCRSSQLSSDQPSEEKLNDEENSSPENSQPPIEKKQLDPIEYCTWLEPYKCESSGLPQFSVVEHLTKPPWIWHCDVSKSLDEHWVRAQFPWTGLKAQSFAREKGIQSRTSAESGDLSDAPIPAKLVDQLLKGKCFFGHSMSSPDKFERLVSVLCIRIVDRSGRFLVRTSRRQLGEGYDSKKALGEVWHTVDNRAQWPGKASERPADLFAEVEKLIMEQVLVPKGTLKLSLGEISYEECEPDHHLNVTCRYIRHFVNAQLPDPMPVELEQSLGVQEGRCIVETNNESIEFTWWDSAQCDANIPGGGSTATKMLASDVV